MSGRGRGLGLRGRIVGVVFVTAVATLVVAAVTLLGPLEHSLRTADQNTLVNNLKKDTISKFSGLSLSAVTSSPKDQRTLCQAQTSLAIRLGATVVVMESPGPDGGGSHALPACPSERTNDDDTYADVAAAFKTHRKKFSFGTIDGAEFARAAVPFVAKDDLLYVLAVRKPIVEIPSAVSAVRTAFLTAALAGLLLTLILGIPLSATTGAAPAAPARGRARARGRGTRRPDPGRHVPRRGRRPCAHAGDHATAPPGTGGGAQVVRGDRVARAPDAVDVARWDARAARR